MYDPIFSKSFSRSERKRIGSCAIFLCFIIAFSISLSFNPHLHLLSLTKSSHSLHNNFSVRDGVKTQLSVNVGANNIYMVDDGTRRNIKPIAVHNPNEIKQLPSPSEAQNKAIINKTIKSTYFGKGGLCRNNSNYCEMEGDIRIEAKSSTIVIVTNTKISKSWSMEPYPRKGTSRVKKWRVTLLGSNAPKCTQHHSQPAILFSIGGFTGNYFHDFADVLFPLYATSVEFKGEVKFLASDHKPWWIGKFTHILNKLTKHKVLDIDGETSQVHCFKKMRIGLKFHKELIIHPPSLMHGFRRLLREAYSLQDRRRGRGRPRLMIISRKHTRVITNQRQVSRMAAKMGFEVVTAEAAGVSRLASCDVLMGVHGAGLTNMLFLRDDAIVIQVIPFGGVDGFARLDFGNPSAGMKLRHLEYKIGAKESSLTQTYSMDHPILRNPELYVSWNQVWSIYLNQQNVTLDLRRFKPTLAKALNLLRHSH